MRLKISILAVLFLALAAGAGLGAHTEISNVAEDAVHGVQEAIHSAEGAAHESHAEESHGLPPNAVPVFSLGPLQVTNSMIVVWIVGIGIILAAQMATREVSLVPAGLQNLVEMLVEGLYGFFEDIVGKHLIKQTFWFFSTIFIFILFSNWFGLIPGLGTIGYGYADPNGHGFVVDAPLLRGANADLNMTSAMAIAFFVMWFYWSIKSIGAGGMLGHIFSVKGHGGGFLGLFLVAVFVVVGGIEIVSICMRPVALMFRLYGNIFAGENILETVMHMGGPILGGVFVFPFYVLEMLVGLVQALVFALLTSVFTALMCEHHDEGEAHAH